ncbi:hypothetical protein KIN20_024806 [Parelaphostrongylus tenuis]|uniref:Uncharacterized protein n=1 Tax=Parelaphostrongylus tenuis TaxID=148309 RepID=A0AAD5MU20_PARTN|nr:hypothetical protein KIN20_024806 [Parelaphostrongylus tenuis]
MQAIITQHFLPSVRQIYDANSRKLDDGSFSKPDIKSSFIIELVLCGLGPRGDQIVSSDELNVVQRGVEVFVTAIKPNVDLCYNLLPLYGCYDVTTEMDGMEIRPRSSTNLEGCAVTKFAMFAQLSA